MTTLYRSLKAKLPTTVNNTVRRLTIASLIGQIVLVGTGGAVRLTSSGLGCPTWPKCTSGSLVNTPEMGIHGIIEFGNRTLTFALAIVALAMLLSLLNLRKERADMFWLSFGLLASIPAQGIIGGITVLSNLNPWVVGLHFLVSATLVVFSMLLVNRAYGRPPETQQAVRSTLRQLSVAAAVLVYITVILGVMVTGSGPHAGDAKAPRNGLDPELITRVHALPVYLLVACTLLLLVLCWRRGRGDLLRSAIIWLLLAVVLQAIIGFTQYFTGLPIVLVGLHMLGAAALLAAGTNVADIALRSRRSA
ncbi:cytochrome c oxidase assembly protein subunit 15 [Psychromicrobium silvestre]|uniref:Cytochrome c oxidase assembly protein subunit 15 n=1 Tax=Psychromicrobium silvestre TaxID=1645614 RepID=A0A7Y9S419_9MICC|nr:COX15/CtaA family protein [Psychromicrobium silvestre]NYE94188.1 cytochrome c oxidase assembly protein subunit 15 [Psychromicrobium silvestre]